MKVLKFKMLVRRSFLFLVLLFAHTSLFSIGLSKQAVDRICCVTFGGSALLSTLIGIELFNPSGSYRAQQVVISNVLGGNGVIKNSKGEMEITDTKKQAVGEFLQSHKQQIDDKSKELIKLMRYVALCSFSITTVSASVGIWNTYWRK